MMGFLKPKQCHSGAGRNLTEARARKIPAYAGMTIEVVLQRILFILLIITPTQIIHAQPLELTADGYLEWQRAAQKVIVTKNVIITQQGTSLYADRVEATYKDIAGTMEMSTLTATGNVRIIARDTTAYGDKAVYDANTGVATMTGDGLKLVSADQTLTARDTFTYDTNAGIVRAKGAVKVVRPKPNGRGQDTLTTDTMIATLKTDVQGKRTVDTLEAKGNIIIKTPDETVKGVYGIYKASTNKITMTNGVTVTRGQNILQGAKADVNLNTNISQIYGGIQSPAGSGRVRGVFFPASQDE